MKQVIVSTALALFAAGALPGCATSRSTHFPSPEALDALSASPAAPVALKDAPTPIAEWTLTGPFPEVVQKAPHPADSAFQRAFVPALAKARQDLTVTGNLSCVAREAGLYLLGHEGEVPRDLLRFMAGRCQVGTLDVGIATLGGDVPAERTEEEWVTGWSPQVTTMVERIAQSTVERAGLWAGRKDGKAVVVIARANGQDAIEAVAAIPEVPGAFTVRGTVAAPNVERISGWINRGAWGSARCVPDPSVTPPSYALRCEGAPADANAWIEVGAWEKDRILGETAAMLLVSPSGAPDATFRWTPAVAGADDAEPVDRRFLTLLNQVREQAGLTPLTLHSKESATAARLAPHYFEARMDTHDTKVQDVIALGLMAGWDVRESVVQRGTFLSAAMSGTPSIADLVTSSLLYPSGREALLEPKARLLAVGAAASEDQQALGMIASAYVLVEERPRQEQAAQVIAALNRARAAKGLEPATWVAAPGTSAEDALRIVTEEHDPDAGGDAFLRAVVHAAHARMTGWTLQTWDLEDIHFPPQVVMTPKLSVVLAVTPYRDPHEPWGGYVILMVLPEAANVRPIEAKAGTPPLSSPDNWG